MRSALEELARVASSLGAAEVRAEARRGRSGEWSLEVEARGLGGCGASVLSALARILEALGSSGGLCEVKVEVLCTRVFRSCDARLTYTVEGPGGLEVVNEVRVRV